MDEGDFVLEWERINRTQYNCHGIVLSTPKCDLYTTTWSDLKLFPGKDSVT